MSVSFYLAPVRGKAAPAVLTIKTFINPRHRIAEARWALLISGHTELIERGLEWTRESPYAPGTNNEYDEAQVEQLAIKQASVALQDAAGVPDQHAAEFKPVSSTIELQDWLLVGGYGLGLLGRLREFAIAQPADQNLYQMVDSALRLNLS